MGRVNSGRGVISKAAFTAFQMRPSDTSLTIELRGYSTTCFRVLDGSSLAHELISGCIRQCVRPELVRCADEYEVKRASDGS
jgi:hypothetical protein